MRKISAFVVIILIAAISISAGKKYKFHGKKLQQVKIETPGSLYSTYDLGPEDKSLISRAVDHNDKVVDEIVTYSNERSWPEPMSDLDWRVSHRSVISSFNAYKLCTLSGGEALLVVPQSKNKHVKEVKLTHDIYIIIRADAISNY